VERLLYLAYGSNLHPVRLRERVPSARLLGVVGLTGWALRFHKRSEVDGSGKCNLLFTASDGHRAYGAVYELDAAQRPALDAAEGAGYRRKPVAVELDGRCLHPFAYLAEPAFIDEDLAPFAWYKALVMHGARFQGLPSDYVAAIEAIRAQGDPDAERRRRNAATLEAINAYRPSPD